jgi:hypothetical protein
MSWPKRPPIPGISNNFPIGARLPVSGLPFAANRPEAIVWVRVENTQLAIKPAKSSAFAYLSSGRLAKLEV